MSVLGRFFQAGLLGMFVIAAPAAIADPVALTWIPGCENSGPVDEGEAAIVCGALGSDFSEKNSTLYGVPVSYAATLGSMKHIDLFPFSTNESDVMLGGIAFLYLGHPGDTIEFTGGSLRDETGKFILGTDFSGAVDAGSSAVRSLRILDVDIPIQGCDTSGIFCTAFFPIGGSEKAFGAAIFHDILFTATALNTAECNSDPEACFHPTIDPIGAFFFRGSLPSFIGNMRPVGTVGDWVSIPEPTTLGLVGFALAGLGFGRRR